MYALEWSQVRPTRQIWSKPTYHHHRLLVSGQGPKYSHAVLTPYLWSPFLLFTWKSTKLMYLKLNLFAHGRRPPEMYHLWAKTHQEKKKKKGVHLYGVVFQGSVQQFRGLRPVSHRSLSLTWAALSACDCAPLAQLWEPLQGWTRRPDCGYWVERAVCDGCWGYLDGWIDPCRRTRRRNG